MDSDDVQVFSGGRRAANDTALEESGLFGTHRRWTNINCFEIIFLLIGVSAAIATDGLTIYRLAQAPDTKDPDFVYGILIIVNSLFLLLFLFTGIFQQRITDIVAFFISAVMLTIYVIIHFVLRQKTTGGENHTEATVRLIRLICTCVFNVCFIPLSLIVIQDYERDEFAKRVFGAFPAARQPLKIYNIFDCMARINTMLSISTFLLNLYNWNDFEAFDKIFLGVGIPLTFLWLGTGIGMIRLENLIFAGVFYLISVCQPAFLVYCLYSAIDHNPERTTVPPTTITTSIFSTSTSSIFSSTTSSTVSSSTITLTTMTATSATTTTIPHVFSVPAALFVCIGINFLTHISSLVLAFLCIRNFGKGLKGRIFNNRIDKWFQRHWSKS